MLGCGRKLAACAAAISLLSGTGAAVAAQVSRAPAPALEANAQAQPANPWLTLSAMTASSSATSTTEAATGEAVQVGWPHIAPLSVVLGTIATAIYILLDEDNNKRDETTIIHGIGLSPTPLSPA